MSSNLLNERETKEYSEDNDDLFYFESDHLALRGNKDYSDLLKTIAILEAQREGAIKDIDTIIEIQRQALEDPRAFVQKLKNKENIGVPLPQEIAEIPDINWSKYGVPIPEDLFRLISQDKSVEPDSEIPAKKPRKPKDSNNDSATFSKPWTSEEQKKLEELLVKFPPEAVEMRRYKKIAEALGTRNVKQVTSRVQKYFKKLYHAGLPIPGRIPKSTDRKKNSLHKHQKHNYLYRPTTFFPDLNVPVFMPENDDEIPESSVLPPNLAEDSRSGKPEERDELQLKIDLLRRVRAEKERDNNIPVFVHEGYRCNFCDEEPMTGSRWHCLDCRQESIDFCTDCVVSQLNLPGCHPLTHYLAPLHDNESEEASENFSTTESSMTQIKSEPVSDSDSESSGPSSGEGNNIEEDSLENGADKMFVHSYDKDYVSDTFASQMGKYNYLDPNFLPE